jgi:hypothetical protein
MDTSTLVKDGHQLLRILDAENLRSPLAAWLSLDGALTWKLNVLMPNDTIGTKEFYSKITNIIIRNSTEFSSLMPSDVTVITRSSELVPALSMFGTGDFGDMRLNGVRVNHYFIDQAVVLRSTLLAVQQQRPAWLPR